MSSQRQAAPQEIIELKVAAVTLFGLQQAVSREFWKTLTLTKLKKAFREKARLYHPDLYPQARPELLQVKQEHFIRLKLSYEVLHRFLGADLFQNFD
jgi:flagellar biosynthesis protein FlhG